MNIAECPHFQKWQIWDYKEGTIVCQECALVLSDQLYLHNNHQSSKNDQKKNTVFFKIRDVVENCHLYPCIARKAYQIYETFPNSTKQTKKRDGLIAFSIYKACIEEEVPRSLREISYFCNVRDVDIGFFESRCCMINNTLPSTFLDRMDFPLCYEKKKKIIHLANVFSKHSSCSPLGILTSCIYIMQSKKVIGKNNKMQKNPNWISLKDIKNKTGICSSTLNKTIKQIKLFLNETDYKLE